MQEKALNPSLKDAKNAYFSAADSVLEKKGLTDTSAEALRKLLAKGAENKKAAGKKAAS